MLLAALHFHYDVKCKNGVHRTIGTVPAMGENRRRLYPDWDMVETLFFDVSKKAHVLFTAEGRRLINRFFVKFKSVFASRNYMVHA